MQRALIIDDDTVSKDCLSEILTGLQFEVMGAASGQAGLDLCRTADFDIIFTDVYMPEMDGIEVIAILKQLQLPSRVVVITGGASCFNSGFITGTMRLMGVDSVIHKPVTQRKILDVLDIIALQTTCGKVMHDRVG